MFDGAEAKSHEFPATAGRTRAGTTARSSTRGVIASSNLDGIHFKADEPSRVGEAIAAEGRRLLA